MPSEKSGPDKARVREFLDLAEPRALRDAVGLRWITTEPGLLHQEVVPSAGFVDGAGLPSLGALAVLVDSTLGASGAVAGRYRMGVTVGLRIDLTAPLPESAGVVYSFADRVVADKSGSWVSGPLRGPRGSLLGEASVRALSLNQPGGTGRYPVREGDTADRPRPEEGIGDEVSTPAGSPVDALGITGAVQGEGRSSLEVRTRPELANGGGRLHGGIVAALAHRAARLAAATVAGDQAIGDLVLDVDFLRPVSPRFASITVVGRVASRSRRFAWADAEVLLESGQVAARARLLSSLD